MRPRFFLLALLAVGACAERWEPVVFEDEGELCFRLDGPNTVVQVDPGCVSGSCTRELSGSCEVTVDAMTVTITSEVSYEEHVNANECTTDCQSVSVTCTVAALADGTYTVVHGESESQLAVPDGYGCPI